MALGRSCDVAINHSAKALALHAANHPETLHLDSNIWDVDPLAVTGGRHVGLLWASPDCKHFSKAKGGAPRDRNIRDLAWVVVDWAEKAKPDVICMENVEEFTTWCPLGEDGQPIKGLSGVTFDLWIRRLKTAGYKVQWRELRACDYGAPTIRKRWFLIARRDGRPIVWPKPTHGDPKSPAVRKGKLLPWVGAHTCIDWSLPCPSIFDTSAEVMAKHGLRAVRPLAKNTMARVARGMCRYVIEAESPFLVNLTHGGRVEDVAEPFRTITGAHRGEKAVVVPSMMSLKGTDRRDSAITAPHPTVLAGGGHSALVVPSIVGNGERSGQSRPRGGDEPFATITAKADGCIATATLAPSIQRFNGGAGLTVVAPVLTYAQQGGGNRSAEDPHHTICASKKDQNSLIAATMVHVGNGERAGQKPRALDVCAPLNTVVAGGVKHYPVSAFLAQHNNDSRRIGGVNPGRRADDPMATVTATGSHQTPVAAWLAKWYSTPQDPRLRDPMHTITTEDRFSVEVASLAAPPFAPEHHARARQVAEFLREHGAWDGGEFVTLEICGSSYVVIDIGMRMLTPRELFRAQGFPDDYVIEGVWHEDEAGEWRWQPFAKDVQVSCCGNSVCPPIAAAIVGANCQHIAIEEERRMA